MNIFYLDPNPELAAQYHMDKHVIKMPVEMAQMLCTNIYILNGLTSRTQSAKRENYELVLNMFRGFPPRETSPYPFYLFAFNNHPCTIWLRSSQENTKWGLQLFEALLKEYTFRYGKNRDLEKVYYWLMQNFPLDKIENTEFSKPAQAMPENYMNENPVIAYRNYYIGDKRHIAKWKNRETPNWWT